MRGKDLNASPLHPYSSRLLQIPIFYSAAFASDCASDDDYDFSFDSGVDVSFVSDSEYDHNDVSRASPNPNPDPDDVELANLWGPCPWHAPTEANVATSLFEWP